MEEETPSFLNKYFAEIKLVGSGAYGKVYSGIRKDDKKKYAIKVLIVSGTVNMEDVKGEVRNLASINNNKNVVRYYDTWLEELSGSEYVKLLTKKNEEIDDGSTFCDEDEMGSFGDFACDDCVDPDTVDWGDSSTKGDEETESNSDYEFDRTGDDEESSCCDSTTDDSKSYDKISNGIEAFSKRSGDENQYGDCSGISSTDVIKPQSSSSKNDTSEASNSEINLTTVETKIEDGNAPKFAVCIQMEFCSGGDLSQMIKNRELHFGTQEGKAKVLNYFQQIANGVSVIHKQLITHGDLKPGNILRERETMKIGDFGLARGDSDTKSTILGTIGYAAPEILTGHYDNKIDVYSLGIILFEMCLSPATRSEFIFALDNLKNNRKVPGVIENQYQMYKELILEMTEEDPTKRPTVDEVLRRLAVLDEDMKKISQLLPFVQQNTNLWPHLSSAIETKIMEQQKEDKFNEYTQLEHPTTDNTEKDLLSIHQEIMRAFTEIHVLHGAQTMYVDPFIPSNLLKESGIEYHEIQSPLLVDRMGELKALLNNYSELIKVVLNKIPNPTSYIIRVPAVQLHFTKDPSIEPALVYVNTTSSIEQHQFNILETITLIVSFMTTFLDKTKLHISHTAINEFIHNNKEIEEFVMKKPVQKLKDIISFVQRSKNEAFSYILQLLNYLNENENIVYDLSISVNCADGIYFVLKNDKEDVALSGCEMTLHNTNLKTVGYWINVVSVCDILEDKKVLFTKRKVQVEGLTNGMGKAAFKVYLDYFGFRACFDPSEVDHAKCYVKLKVHKDLPYDFFKNSFCDIPVTANIYFDKNIVGKVIATLGKAIPYMQKQYKKRSAPTFILDDKLVSSEVFEKLQNLISTKWLGQTVVQSPALQNFSFIQNEFLDFKRAVKKKFFVKRGTKKTPSD
ncbi:interferon-induced, double-stranded RNA-activated protein kinase, putative [Entamoeba invadens IP1]|uniref:interferon-induced, double-stranded RNA-activated protein kinase, putative n=1 Tax=Entamoeba invadens IP1 TaxID=370355 RepID=UPI0002C3EFD4|nr:interferon-induced, double-stranded RNA-activated protein kinase, putative [Entamoeba invadens IP1]ELP93010.1 interferon-induced, double-stranded RNA-activated protein kinase, putative [Entamoeba invadens IP1]|eukprot:XP_004259781.1 interferon-induced, double-stranded RNA-activated protein kinase, putative [Entamoeba invadens IP1]